MQKKKTKKSAAQIKRITIRKALKAWSLEVRRRDGSCAVCGRTEHLNAHHLIPKENFKDFQLEVNNGLALCPKCHKFGAFSFHKHPMWAARWLAMNKPEQYAWIMERIEYES